VTALALWAAAVCRVSSVDGVEPASPSAADDASMRADSPATGAVTAMRTACAGSAFGMDSRSSPFSKVAVACSATTPLGSVTERVTLPRWTSRQR
jgi:hypothetical protein